MDCFIVEVSGSLIYECNVTPGHALVLLAHPTTHFRFKTNGLTSSGAFSIPLTISTTKRLNTCLVPSSDSWIIQAKKMDPCTSFCSKRVRTVSCSGVPFGTHKSETYCVVIYFGMRCVVPETPKPSSASHARPARIIKRRNVRKNLALATGDFIF